MGTDWKQWGEEGKESRTTPRHVVWALGRKWCHHLHQESIGDRDSEGFKLQLRLPMAKSCLCAARNIPWREDQLGDRDLGVFNTYGQTIRIFNHYALFICRYWAKHFF